MKSVSVTTRPRRPREREGIDYEFVTDAEFDRLVGEGSFLEWAVVHGNRYGTPRARVYEGLAAGRTVVLEIDIQGARSIRTADPDALLIFIDPPSWDVLEGRLTGRGTDPPEVVAERLRNAKAELSAAAEFDHRVTNDRLEVAIEQVIRILEGDTAAGGDGPARRRNGEQAQENP
jgi:guanylate kinase